MNGNPKPIRGARQSTARLDVALFIRRWKRLMSRGKVTSTIRTIRREGSITSLSVDQLVELHAQAEAYHQIRDVIMQQSDLKPIQRYAYIRSMIKITDEGGYNA